MKKYFVIFIFLFFPIANSNAVEDDICVGGAIPMPATTPTTQFMLGDENDQNKTLVVIDQKTRLMWARCTYDYEWDVTSNTCLVKQGVGVIVDWSQALTIASNSNSVGGAPGLAGFSDWRLPNIRELESIIERKCKGIAVNKIVFPGTPLGPFWSNTNTVSNTGSITSARTVDFTNGNLSIAPSNVALFLRLVRDID